MIVEKWHESDPRNCHFSTIIAGARGDGTTCG